MTVRSGGSVALVTPWYPTLNQPFRGAFVRAAVAATASLVRSMTVYHCDSWVHWLAGRDAARVDKAYRELVPLSSGQVRMPEGAGLVYLPVPVRAGRGDAEIARRHEEVLRASNGGKDLEADVVHAHVGLPSGWAAIRNASPGARVFVTEHASYLDRVLAQAEAKRMYDEVIARSSGFFAVSAGVRETLVAAFPHHAGRISIIANPVSFGFSTPATGVAKPASIDLRRWLSVGNLLEQKGLLVLLEAFAACRARDEKLSLTVVGDGPLRARLVERARELGISAAVTFTGAVPPDAALALMREHDLLVHASRRETFGMVVVEAIAAGLPVLVTRCGGPEETLAGIEDAAGELVAVEDGPQSLIDGYWRLRERFPAGVDLGRARAALASRYGFDAFAKVHENLWFGSLPATDPSAAGLERSAS